MFGATRRALWFSALFLAACGGGGGGSGGSSPGPLAFQTAGPVQRTFGDSAFSNPATGGTAPISYSSASTAIAVVDSAGLVTIKGAGSTTITAADAASHTASYSLEIAKAAQTITLSQPSPLTILVGVNVPAPVSGSVGPGALSYSSTAPAIISVNATTGELLALTTGSADITIDKAGDANHNAMQAMFTVDAVSAFPGLSAWIGTKDTLVSLDQSTISNVGFYRSTSADCDLAHYASCPNGQYDLIGGGPVIDTAVNLTRQGFYWLQLGGTAIGPAAVSATTFPARAYP